MALAFSTPVLAEEDQVTAAADRNASTGTTPNIVEIVVTAQRRSESAQRTALSIAVLGGNDLKEAGGVSPDDLSRLLPGVQVSGGTSTQIYVRGIGDYGVTAQSNPAVVTNIDGVVVSRPQAISGNFFDIERVEMLKGPQGTLYGRNASGGVLNLITVQPRFGELGGYIDGIIGNYSQFGVEGALNVPVGDAAAFRASYQLNRRDGFLSDGSDDDDREAVRIQGRALAGERMSILGSFSYTHLGGVGSGIVSLPAIPGLPVRTGTTDPAYAAAFLDAFAQQYADSGGMSMPPFMVDDPSLFPLFRDVESYAAHLQLDYEMDFATFTLIPAWRKTHAQLSFNFNYNYNLGAPYNAAGDAPDGERSTQYSLEARLGNESDRLKWVLGGYWFKEDQTTDYQIRAGMALNTRNVLSLGTEAYAAFGQLTYSITDAIRLTGGLRYTSDKRRAFDFERYAISPMILGSAPSSNDCTPPNGAMPGTLCPIYNPTPGFYDSEETFDRLTWKGGVEIDVGPQSLLFADVSTGFKAGGFNQSVTLVTRDSLIPFDPETITAYTIGLKNRFLDNRLQVNLEGFYYDYKNLQMSMPGFDGDNSVVLMTRNAAGATIKGASLDIVAAPWQGGTIRGAVEYVDGEYGNFVVEQPANFVPPGRVGCPVSAPGATGLVSIDCSGFPLMRTPKWSGMVGLDQAFELDNGGDITFSADASFASKTWLAADFHPDQQQAGYVTLASSLTYNAPDKAWYVSAWVRNLTNEDIYVGGGGNQHGFLTGWNTSSIAPPRTYGLRMGFHF
ncbi:TonB-dependent receptor [Croceibacterium atlanticum]|nr:TonB-dependent receptor [Croceibacterium atlanticum]